MKEYKRFMDEISVSKSQHERIMLSIDHSRKIIRTTMIKRYSIIFACFAVALIGLIIIPKFLQVPYGKQDPSALKPPSGLQPGIKTPAPNTSREYTLNFNESDSAVSRRIYIEGHFWDEITASEIEEIFPKLKDTHAIEARINYQKIENEVSIFNIDAHIKSEIGIESHIQMAPGEVARCYVFDTEVKTTDILGIEVAAGYFKANTNSKGNNNIIYFADFKLDDLAYYVELFGPEGEEEILEKEITDIVGSLIEANIRDVNIFNPIVPELKDERLTFDEAVSDTDFGAYLPKNIPNGFVFMGAQRFINQEENMLYAWWENSEMNINWSVDFLDENDERRITSINDRKNYDLSLYPIPRARSIPEELNEITQEPIFRIEELTLDTVKARIDQSTDLGDVQNQRVSFAVLYGDILIRLDSKGVSAEDLFEMLQEIK